MSHTLHTPVLLAETLTYLKVHSGGIYLDGTIGGGGHTQAVLAASAPAGRVVGLDRDPAVLDGVAERLATYGQRLMLRHANYEDVAEIMAELRLTALDGIILDLGLSADQLADPTRGFSFQAIGSLDLRFDPNSGESAVEWLARISVRELTHILGEYGQLRAPHRLSERIMAFRQNHAIRTTADLVTASGLVNPRRRAQLFQALRIAVNDELGTINRALPKLWQVLAPGGRLVVISFHSLEDRLIKTTFRQWALAGEGTILTKKPVIASAAERAKNPRARSAKLRAIQKR